MEQKLVSTSELVALLKIPRHRFIYLMEMGYIPESARRIAGRRVFSEEEVAVIEEIVRKRNEMKKAMTEGVNIHG
jgi:DNA-binding transcriptional MerR regulator